MKIIDMTITYENGMTGMSRYHPIVNIERLGKFEEIGRNTSSILLGSHLGTHMDAQSHFIEDGYTIENVPLEFCMGDVTIVDVRHRKKGDRLFKEDLEKYPLKERVLLLFGWDSLWKTDGYLDGFPSFDIEAARYMYDCGVKLVAMDTPSPDSPPVGGLPEYEIHKFMLDKEMILVESLVNTCQIDLDKDYYFIALPLKLTGCDASPCRAVLIEK